MTELLTELHKYCDELYFEIGGHPEDSKVNLIITAEGAVEHFPKVEALVDSAPALKDWRFIKYRQPLGLGFSTELKGKTFDPEKTIFIPMTSEDLPEAIAIQICYSDYNEDERDLFVNGTFIMLDNLIGELSTALDIDYLDVVQTPSNINEFDFMHVSELRYYIAEAKKQKN